MAPDPFRYFRIEAREILAKLSEGVLGIEKTGGALAPGDLDRLLRACHTLKGAAAVVRQEAIAKLAHDLETAIATQLRRPEVDLKMDVLLGFVDAIRDELATLGQPPVAAPPTARAPVIVGAAPSIAPASAKPAAGPQLPADVAESVRLDLADVDGVLAAIADVTSRIELGRLRVQGLDRLDALARELSALVAAQPDVHERAELLRHELKHEREHLAESLERAERRGADALEAARNLRLLRADTVFGELARAARDAAAMADRRVSFETAGGEQRLDAHVLHLLRDALLQIVRNALAHGIEAPEERTRAGKPAEGKISVGIERAGLRAKIVLRDDGRGIDQAAVRSALVAKKIIGAPEAATLDVNALMNLVMRHGASTRTEATALAGRGVGLRVVTDVVDRLRGTVTVESTPGEGACFALEVPVTVTAAPALLVGAGDRVLSIPLDAVERTARVAANEIVASPSGDSIPEHGESVRFAALARILGTEVATPATWTVVHLATGDRRAAVGVDRILGVANEVVLPLPAHAKVDPVVVGASLDGAGDPRLALDPLLLVAAVRSAAGAPKATTATARKRVLVIDDSLTSRMLEQSILEAAGYEVSTATSGEQGLAIARADGPFDLFVVDVEMPGISGFETVLRTRRDPALANTPAVLVTSLASPEDRRRGLEAGARAYIVKGEFAQDEFLDAVRSLTG